MIGDLSATETRLAIWDDHPFPPPPPPPSLLDATAHETNDHLDEKVKGARVHA